MITQNNFYAISTTLGVRITQAHSQDPATGVWYGTISPSNYVTKGDNVSIGFSTAIREATEEEEAAWVEWYSLPDPE
jgi:hypothetical protein